MKAELQRLRERMLELTAKYYSVRDQLAMYAMQIESLTGMDVYEELERRCEQAAKDFG